MRESGSSPSRWNRNGTSPKPLPGDKFTVRSMVPKGSSPETYDPTPQQLVSLGESEAYLRIGYIGFERSWMDRLMNNTPHIQVLTPQQGWT